MSSAAGSAYWCYQCSRRVTPNSVGGEDVVCPNCSGGFVEEVDVDGGDGPIMRGGGRAVEDAGGPAGFRHYHPQGPRRGFPGGHPAIFQVLEAMSAVLQQIQPGNQIGGLDMDGAVVLGGVGGGGAAAGEGGRSRTIGGGPNSMLVFQGQVPNFFGNGGDVEVFVGNGTGVPRRLPLPGNISEYFLGRGLDQLVQQLAENDPNRHGAPPASKSSVESMPTIQIAEEHLGTDCAQCAVCKDEFELGSQVRQMPCKHMYHPDCILPWLAQHNSCPVCRYEMPTDDPDYNSNRASQPPTVPPGAFTMRGTPTAAYAGGRYGNPESGRESPASSAGSNAAATSTPTPPPTTQTPPSAGTTGSGGSAPASAPAAGQAETSSQGGGNGPPMPSARTTDARGKTGRSRLRAPYLDALVPFKDDVRAASMELSSRPSQKRRRIWMQ